MDWLVPEQDVRRLKRAGLPAKNIPAERSRVAERDFPRWGKSRVPARNKTSQTLRLDDDIDEFLGDENELFDRFALDPGDKPFIR